VISKASIIIHFGLGFSKCYLFFLTCNSIHDWARLGQVSKLSIYYSGVCFLKSTMVARSVGTCIAMH